MIQLRISDCGLRITRAARPRASNAPRSFRNPKSEIRNRESPFSAFTLLEVILALVILGAALAMLGEVMQLASRHAIEARAETQAQTLAASIMDQLEAGAIELESVSRQMLEVDDTTPWVYSVAIGDTDRTGIEPVEVLVEQDIEARYNPVKFRLKRWLPTTLETPEGATPAAGAAGAGGTQQSGSSGTGGAPSGAGGPTS